MGLSAVGVGDGVRSCPGTGVSRAFSHLQAVSPSSGGGAALPLRPPAPSLFCCCAHRGRVTPPSWGQGWLGGTASAAPLPPLGEPGPRRPGSPPWSRAPALSGSQRVCPLGVCVCPHPSQRGHAKDVMSSGRWGGRVVGQPAPAGALRSCPWGRGAAPEGRRVPGCQLLCSWRWLQRGSPDAAPSEPFLAWGLGGTSPCHGVP